LIRELPETVQLMLASVSRERVDSVVAGDGAADVESRIALKTAYSYTYFLLINALINPVLRQVTVSLRTPHFAQEVCLCVWPDCVALIVIIL
jgi:hypothetical protein